MESVKPFHLNNFNSLNSVNIREQVARMCQIEIKWHLESAIFRNGLLKVAVRHYIIIALAAYINCGKNRFAIFCDISNDLGQRNCHDVIITLNVSCPIFFSVQLSMTLLTYDVPKSQALALHPLLHLMTIGSSKPCFFHSFIS